jgi:hydrogenase nickel incorporation protein HypB
MTIRTVHIGKEVLADARRAAAELRDSFRRRGTLVVNLLSSPGAGKTSLLEATARFWNGARRMAVLVGDIATDRDAQRLAPWTPVVQLTTGGACHLELPLIQRGLDALGSIALDFLFIENVGNLVCPASHDLAEHLRVVVLSVTEGDDKPAKYPKMFRTSQALVINKLDLLPYVPFDVDAAIEDARRIQPDITALTASCHTGEGLDAWCTFLDQERTRLRATCHAE